VARQKFSSKITNKYHNFNLIRFIVRFFSSVIFVFVSVNLNNVFFKNLETNV